MTVVFHGAVLREGRLTLGGLLLLCSWKLSFLRWSFMKVVCLFFFLGGGVFYDNYLWWGWSFMKVVFARVVFHEDGLPWGWCFVTVVFRWGGMSCKWSFVTADGLSWRQPRMRVISRSSTEWTCVEVSATEKRMEAVKTKCLRKLLCISYLEHKMNGWVRSKISILVGPQEPLLATVKWQKLVWFGHVTHHDRFSKTIFQGPLEGELHYGWERKCWTDNNKEWASLPIPELLTKASHRKDQKRISAESCVMSPHSVWTEFCKLCFFFPNY